MDSFGKDPNKHGRREEDGAVSNMQEREEKKCYEGPKEDSPCMCDPGGQGETEGRSRDTTHACKLWRRVNPNSKLKKVVREDN